MSDNNFFQRSINVDGNAAESLAAAGDIGSASTVVAVDTTSGSFQVDLPDQVGAAGQQITVVKTVAANDLTIGVQTGDELDGVTDNTTSILTAAGAYASAVFVSTGASWAQVS